MLKNSFALLLIIITLSTGAFAEEGNGGIAKVITASPSTTFEGKKIPEGATLGTLGTLKTGRDGGAKLKMLGNDVLIEIASDTVVKLIRPTVGEPNEVIELVSGMARARVTPMKDQTPERAARPAFILRTKTSTMGVRGTDFLAVVNPVLGESEIVVFSGKVDFTSAADAKDSKLVPTGYWGGIGGRFGAKTHELIKLTAAAIEYFSKIGQDTARYTIEKSPAPTDRSETGH